MSRGTCSGNCADDGRPGHWVCWSFDGFRKEPRQFHGEVGKLMAEKTRLRYDDEPAMKQLDEKIATFRHPRTTILEPTNRAEHQSVGGVERPHQSFQAATRALARQNQRGHLCLDTHSSSGCCDMRHGHTIDSSLKATEAVLLGKSERASVAKVLCFPLWKRA